MNKPLYIAKPCSKQWDELIPQGKDRYCTSCEKVVMDMDSPDAPKPGDINYTGCGKLTTYENKVEFIQLNFFQRYLAKWFGIVSLFFIPTRKAKAQTIEEIIK